MEQRLEVDHDRLIARRDQVLEVAVGRLDGVEEGEEAAQPAVVERHLRARGTARGGDVLHPAVGATVEHAHGGERRHGGGGVQPGEELLEVGVGGERARLVDQLRPGGEGEDVHRPAAAVAVPRAAVDRREVARGDAAEEGCDEERPVRGQAPAELERRRHPEVEALSRLAGEHRVFGEQGGGHLRAAQARDEGGEPLGGGLPREVAAQARHVHLEHQGARQDPHQVEGERRGELALDRGRREGRATAAGEVENPGVQAAARPFDPGRDQGQKAERGIAAQRLRERQRLGIRGGAAGSRERREPLGQLAEPRRPLRQALAGRRGRRGEPAVGLERRQRAPLLQAVAGRVGDLFCRRRVRPGGRPLGERQGPVEGGEVGGIGVGLGHRCCAVASAEETGGIGAPGHGVSRLGRAAAGVEAGEGPRRAGRGGGRRTAGSDAELLVVELDGPRRVGGELGELLRAQTGAVDGVFPGADDVGFVHAVLLSCAACPPVGQRSTG